MKKKEEGLVTLRISGRSKLSKKTADFYENSPNKSALIAEALEFYISFGQNINEQLKELNEKMDGLESLKGGVYQAVPVERAEVISGTSDEVQEKHLIAEESNPVEIEEVESEEQRIERESIENTLGSFMSFTKGE